MAYSQNTSPEDIAAMEAMKRQHPETLAPEKLAAVVQAFEQQMDISLEEALAPFPEKNKWDGSWPATAQQARHMQVKEALLSVVQKQSEEIFRNRLPEQPESLGLRVELDSQPGDARGNPSVRIASTNEWYPFELTVPISEIETSTASAVEARKGVSWDDEELPNGVYEVTYFTIATNGFIRRQAGVDSTGLGNVAMLQRHLKPNEAAVARCVSQLGGLMAAGSLRARELFERKYPTKP